MFNLMGKKIITILHLKNLFISAYVICDKYQNLMHRLMCGFCVICSLPTVPLFMKIGVVL